MKRAGAFKPASRMAAPGAALAVVTALLSAAPTTAVAAPGPGGETPSQLPSGRPAEVAPAPRPRALSVVAEIGRRMFFDPSLSASGQLSCASCHSPANAYGPANGLAVQLGGRELRQPGRRAAPSLSYVTSTPNFTIGPATAAADNDGPRQERLAVAGAKVAAVAKADVAAIRAAQETDQDAVRRGGDFGGGAPQLLADVDEIVPRGGFHRDGRNQTLQTQALAALLDPSEMANADAAQVLSRLATAPYAQDLKAMFGPTLFLQPTLALDEALFALVRFQVEEPGFHPYDSKYDAYLKGKARLSEAEARGLKLFDDPNKGNCASCHVDRPSRRDGNRPPAFTDYQFEALGAPRNSAIPANGDPGYYDLGLCGPVRTDQADAADYCGLFKTPSLRNVATRKVFFHNGVFRSLEEVLHFYVERETNPGKWYPRLGNGEIDRYNDLPARYKQNVDVVDAPFNRREGDEPALSDAEIADVIAFLNALTDGYRPQPAVPEDGTAAR